MNRSLFSCLVFLSILLASCGPSTAGQTATAVSLTETAIPTATLTPIPTSTPTPIPEPDAKAMIAWHDLNLTDKFITLPAEMLGIQEGEEAFSVGIDGVTYSYTIASSFIFADGENPRQLVYGYTVILRTRKDIEVFDTVSRDGLKDIISGAFGIPSISIAQLGAINDIGDTSFSVTAKYDDQNDERWQVSMVAFRVSDIGAWVFVRDKLDFNPTVSVKHVAQVYAASIQNPITYCKIVSVTPITTEEVPTFKFEAEGFYPYEGRFITLLGEVQSGDEKLSALSIAAGLNGETTNEEGRIKENAYFFTLDQLVAQGAQNPEFPTEYTLSVHGFQSGCEATQIVTWPSK